MGNFSVTNLQQLLQDKQKINNMINQYFRYNRKRTGNMGPYYPFEDKLAQATLIHASAKHVMCTLFRFESVLEDIFRLEIRNMVLHYLAFDQQNGRIHVLQVITSYTWNRLVIL